MMSLDRRDYSLSVVGILPTRFFLEADDLAAVLDPDFLDFEGGRILGISPSFAFSSRILCLVMF
jgi:hypothetical protein